MARTLSHIPGDAGLAWLGEDERGRRAVLTEILAQVSREALLGEGLEAVLRGIVQCLVQRLPVAIASIILLNDDATWFVKEVWAGELDLGTPAGALEGSVWPVSIGVAGRCARSGQAQLINDVSKDPDYLTGNDAVQAEYIVPIRHHDRLLGVLNLESTHRNFFSVEVCAVFDAVAVQVAGAIHLARVVGELEAANRKLEQLSMSDGLTGIANRRCFDERLACEWQRGHETDAWLALLLVDADCFKPLNDACGHLYGDECLRGLARLCLEQWQDDEALVARYGGEELAILLPGVVLSSARAQAERLRKRVQRAALPHPASQVAPHVTVSIGAAALRPRATWPSEKLIALADGALYAAKSGGRNRVATAGVRSRLGAERPPMPGRTL